MSPSLNDIERAFPAQCQYLYADVTPDEQAAVAVDLWAGDFGGVRYIATVVPVAALADKLIVQAEA